MSHGANVLSVCLDFRLRSQAYRLVRKAKVSSKGQVTTSATFAQVTTGGERSLASGVTEVDAAVKERLGLDFSAFTQTVILPQNQFAAFLRAKPRDRRTMLQQLLGHAVYPRMRELAQTRRTSLDARLRSLGDQLDALAHATPEALGALDVTLTEARDAERTAQAQYQALSMRVQDLHARRELTLALEQWVATLADLDRQLPSIDAAAVELSQANRAATIAPLIEAAADAGRKAAKASTDLNAARTDLRDKEHAREAAERAFDEATNGASSLEDWRAHLRRFDEIKIDVERLPALTSDFDKAKKALEAAERQMRETGLKAEQLRTAAAAAAAKLAQATESRDAVQHNAALQTTIEARIQDAADARALGGQIAELESSRAALASDLLTRQETLAAAQARRADAQAHLDVARSGLETADRARHEGHQRHASAALRRELAAGAPCPVCEQIVAAVPGDLPAPELERLEERYRTAREAEAQAVQTLQSASTSVTTAEAEVRSHRAQIQGIEGDRNAKQVEMQRLMSAIAAAASVPETIEVSALLQAFNDALTRARATARERAIRERVVVEAEQARAAAEIAATRADGDEIQAKQRLDQARADRTRCEAALDEVRDRIAGVTSAPDPAAARADLADRIERAEQAVARASEAARQAREAAGISAARVESLETASAEAAAVAAVAEERMASALAEHGFASALDAQQAARPPDTIRALDQRVAAFRTDHAAARRRVDELTAQVGSDPVDATAMDASEKQLAAAKTAADAAVATAARLDGNRQRLAADVERASTLAAERTTAQVAYDVAHEMESDLRSDGFQHFLLTEAFRTLVAGASTRLREMSRRYSMEWRDDDFYVVDHDNAGERRRAETLSGGETFMASLCLALQLSDEILQASGAVRMDSLFIDEGFGSLDPISLGEVADALDSLRAGGDRLVGIISHVPELTERLPGCIRIDKGVGESKWVVERVG